MTKVILAGSDEGGGCKDAQAEVAAAIVEGARRGRGAKETASEKELILWPSVF